MWKQLMSFFLWIVWRFHSVLIEVTSCSYCAPLVVSSPSWSPSTSKHSCTWQSCLFTCLSSKLVYWNPTVFCFYTTGETVWYSLAKAGGLNSHFKCFMLSPAAMQRHVSSAVHCVSWCLKRCHRRALRPGELVVISLIRRRMSHSRSILHISSIINILSVSIGKLPVYINILLTSDTWPYGTAVSLWWPH